MHAAGVRYWARTLAISDQAVVPRERLAEVRAQVERVREQIRHGAPVPPEAELPPQADPAGHLVEALTALVDERGRAVAVTELTPVE